MPSTTAGTSLCPGPAPAPLLDDGALRGVEGYAGCVLGRPKQEVTQQ